MQRPPLIPLLILLGVAHCQSSASADARNPRPAGGAAASAWPSWLPPDQLLKSSQQVPSADVEVAHQSLGALMPRRTGPEGGAAFGNGAQSAQRPPTGAGAQALGSSGAGTSRAVGRRPRRNNPLRSLNDAPPAASLPRPVRRSESSSMRLAPREKWLTPGAEHMYMQHMLPQLGANYEQEFMSVSDRSGQEEREAFGPKYTFDAELRRLVDAMNLSAYEPEAAALTWEVQSVFKSVLLRQASCLVLFRWADEGLLTWPRYIKRGVRQFSFLSLFSPSATPIPFTRTHEQSYSAANSIGRKFCNSKVLHVSSLLVKYLPLTLIKEVINLFRI